MARRPRPWYRQARKAWFVTIAGVQHNLGPHKKQAYDAFYKLMRQPRERKVSAHTVAAIADAFLDWVQKHRAPDTYEWYRYRLQRFVDRYPDLRVEHLRPFHAQEWVDSYPHFTRTSRRNYLRSIKRCLKWATKLGYIDEDPLVYLEMPANESREVLVTDEEYEAILSHISDATFYDLVVTTWETGCRPQESLRVEARHVDLANQRWVFPSQESKGKRSPRIVYLTDKASAITQRLKLRYPDGMLFRNTRNHPWTPDAVNCAFDRIRIQMGKAEMKRQGLTVSDDEVERLIPRLSPTRCQRGQRIPKSLAELRSEARRKLTNRRAASLVARYSLYALRHSWATRALQSGLDGLTVAILMGHSDPSMLAKVYQHLAHNPGHLLQQAKRVSSTA